MKKTRAVIGIAILLVVTFLLSKIAVAGVRFMRETGVSPSLVARLLLGDGLPLKSSQDRTNVLILGIGGAAHDGPNLTDTMMVFSLDTVKKSAALIAIPRDIWSDTLKDKVNSAYHYGQEKSAQSGKKGDGILLAKIVAEDVIGMPIQYAFVVDFTGFQDVIDLLGGIDVRVEKAFTDKEYPIPGKEHDTCPEDDPENTCVYQTVHFDAGWQHMDGARALVYVRSRHAEGEEGSDFARNKRQQNVIVAIKERAMHPDRWFTFERAGEFPKVLDEATDTDMTLGELATVAKQFSAIKGNQIKRIAIDDLLESPPDSLYGRFVLVPKTSYEDIHAYIQTQLQ